MVDGKYFLKYFYQSPFSIFQNNIAFSDKKYLTIINSYKYQKNKNPSDLYGDRIKAIKYFASESDIDLYGVGWDKCKSDTILSKYKGVIDSKVEVLENYKYAIAFENSKNEPGGICEKIFDVMAAGCVPIYWGAPNVLDYIPKEAFIDYRNFNNYRELDLFLKSITENEYNDYLNAISDFMKSDMHKNFTSYGFVRDVSNAIDYTLKLPPRKKSVYKIKLELLFKLFIQPGLIFKSRRLLFDVLCS